MHKAAATPAPVRTFAEWAQRYEPRGLDYADVTVKNLSSHLRAILATLGDCDPAISPRPTFRSGSRASSSSPPQCGATSRHCARSSTSPASTGTRPPPSGREVEARRWVAVPSRLMVEVQESCPPDNRTAERRVFPGGSREALRNAMARACKAAGIAHYSPHDLRHRYASVNRRGRAGDAAGGRSWGTRRSRSRWTRTPTFWSIRRCAQRKRGP
jgi:hypothetical protein